MAAPIPMELLWFPPPLTSASRGVFANLIGFGIKYSGKMTVMTLPSLRAYRSQRRFHTFQPFCLFDVILFEVAYFFELESSDLFGLADIACGFHSIFRHKCNRIEIDSGTSCGYIPGFFRPHFYIESIACILNDSARTLLHFINNFPSGKCWDIYHRIYFCIPDKLCLILLELALYLHNAQLGII